MLHTVEQVINKLGGSAEVAKLIGVGVPAVSNAKNRQHFPHSWRMKIWQEAQRREIEIAPHLIGMDESPTPAPASASEAA